MWNRLTKRPSLAVFAAALLVRLIYFAAVDQPPVQFDARQYVAVAAAAPIAVWNPSLWNDTTARENISFSRVMNDLIDDETVIWAPYDPPTFGQALDWLFFSGPAYPAFLTAIFHLTPAHDFWVVRIAQAILDALTAALIGLVMARLISPLGGAIAAGAWVVYGPAIVKTAELLTETFSIFLVVLLVWLLLRAYDLQSRKWLIAAGAVCSILAMGKASTALLIAPVLAAWLWANRGRALRPRTSVVCLLGSWLIVMLPWLFLVNHRYGRFAVRDPSYGTANFRQANILETEGYNTDMAPVDFWTYPVWRELSNRPMEYARLYLQKFRRLWWRACDDYRIGFPFGPAATQWLHRLIVLLAALGMWLWTRRAGPPVWLALAVIVYFAGLHTMMHVVSRYNLPAMPFVIGAAVTGAFWLVRQEMPGALRRLGIVGGLVLLALLVLAMVRPSFWLMVPGVSAATAAWLYWIVGLLVIIATVGAAIVLCGHRGWERWAYTVVVGGGVALVFLGWATTREGHAEWAASIEDPQTEISRRIILPADLHLGSVKRAYVLIDANITPGSDFKVVTHVDHVRSAFPESLIISDDSFYGKPHYRNFMRYNGDVPATIRGWSRNLFEGPLLDSILADGQVEVRLGMESEGAPRGALIVYGDLPQENPDHWDLPGLTYSSIERYYEGADPRIWQKLTISSDSTVSVRIENGQSDFDDLSERWGRQPGQYRMILQLLLADERSLYF
ncbi:MAG TPA: glycosyltransferase family 39 protein [bacterium]|nr:glycosyltransferase family 39 protein [bacterium]